jgi:hypothetical protein
MKKIRRHPSTKNTATIKKLIQKLQQMFKEVSREVRNGISTATEGQRDLPNKKTQCRLLRIQV